LRGKGWLERANAWLAAHDPLSWAVDKISDGIWNAFKLKGDRSCASPAQRDPELADVYGTLGRGEGFDYDEAGKALLVAPFVATGLAAAGQLAPIPDLPDIGPLKFTKAKKVKGGQGYELPGGYVATVGRHHGRPHIDVNPPKGARGRGMRRYRVWPDEEGGYRLEERKR
jgi:hypothetical protein